MTSSSLVLRSLELLLAGLLVAAAVPIAARAQAVPAGPASIDLFPNATPLQAASTPSLAPAGLSLVLPGLGQHRLKRDRKWLFAAAEVVGWFTYANRRSAGREARDGYRDFAWNTGRMMGTARVDGDFDYYETMTKWQRSGAFDRNAGAAGLQPEDDESTFNGSVWTLARRIHMGSGAGLPGEPGYEQAIAYYSDRAYGDDFLWDWTPVAGGRDELGRLIAVSDDRFREATTALGFLIANHLLAAVDAFLASGQGEGPLSLRLEPSATPAGRVPAPGETAWSRGWSAVVRIPVGR